MIQLFLLLSFFAGIVFSDTECPAVTTIGDRRSDKSKLRLVQYNVEWLFISKKRFLFSEHFLYSAGKNRLR